MDINKLQRSTATLANATELATRVILEIAGNDISNSISGEPATMEVLNNIVLGRIQRQTRISEIPTKAWNHDWDENDWTGIVSG